MKIITFSGKAQHGKSTSAKIIKQILDKNNLKSVIVNYGGHVKYIAGIYYDWDGTKSEEQRTILQTVGTEIGRTAKDTFWVDRLMEDIQIFAQHFDYILIDDCRFVNEIEIPKSIGHNVITVNIKRHNFDNGLTQEQKNHKSETSLDNYNFDYTVHSDNGIENLKTCINELYKEISKGY